MSRHQSEFVRAVVERGFVHQATDLEGLDRLAAGGHLVAYIGFDCTADSLHVGHLVSIMLLRWLQRTGHRPIALIGGGTTKVGDPSGKDESRQLLDEATIEHNIQGIRRWSTMPSGWMSCATSSSCAATGATSPSIACSRSNP
jgi:tyrosyl-tRNA synthetase